MSTMLRLAILGAGWAGERQIQAIGDLNRKVTVACLVDSDAEHLAAKAYELDISKTYTDYHDALRDPDVDAVSICLPHQLHCPVALDAASAKKHILCEKPIALTVEDAARMIEAGHQHAVKLYVAEHWSYTPVAKFLRRVVQSGDPIGELITASMTWGFRAENFGYPGRRAWLTELDQGGTGTWMLHGIHTMAQLRYVFGEVETIYLREHHAGSFQRTELEGTMSGVLTMASGLHITIMQSCELRMQHNLGGYILHGERGSLRAFDAGYQIYTNQQTHTVEPPIDPYPVEALDAYAQEIEAFADYVAGTQIGPTTGISERRSLAIVQAGYESMQSGHPVALAQRFGDDLFTPVNDDHI